jgi:hypothetical protein
MRPTTARFTHTVTRMRPKRKAGTLLAQRARHFIGGRLFLYFLNFLYVLYLYFFGRDSGGTNPDTR